MGCTYYIESINRLCLYRYVDNHGYVVIYAAWLRYAYRPLDPILEAAAKKRAMHNLKPRKYVAVNFRAGHYKDANLKKRFCFCVNVATYFETDAGVVGGAVGLT